MELRNADTDDIPEIQDVAEICYQSAYDGVLNAKTIDKVLEDRYSGEELAEIISSDNSILAVAEENNQIVGFAFISWKESDAELESIYIIPEYQGQGIGTKMLDFVIKKIPDQVESVGVGAIKENEAARRFYTSKGFEEKDEVMEDFYGEKAECQTFIKKLD